MTPHPLRALTDEEQDAANERFLEGLRSHCPAEPPLVAGGPSQVVSACLVGLGAVLAILAVVVVVMCIAAALVGAP